MFAMHVAEATFAILMIRTAVRAGCVTRIYGWFFALGVPFRAVYGNVLNTAATVNAVVRYVIARVQGKPLKWLKTDHAYPGRAALLAHKRLLGEILVDSGRLTAAALKAALETQPEGKRLGEHLVATGRLNIESLYDALSFQQGLPIAEVEPREVARPLAHALPKRAVKKWQILPFGVQDGHLLLVSPEAPSNQLLEELRGLTRLETRFHLVTPAEFDRLTTALL